MNALSFGVNHSLPILNCPLLFPDERSRAVDLSNVEMIQGVAVEIFSSCLDSSESESSSKEARATTCKEPRKKNTDMKIELKGKRPLLLT